MDDTGGQDLPNTRGDEAVMAIEITVPTLGESVADATVARWIKTTGDAVAADEPVVELETDKVTLEVPAPACLLYTSPSPRDLDLSRMPSSA